MSIPEELQIGGEVVPFGAGMVNTGGDSSIKQEISQKYKKYTYFKLNSTYSCYWVFWSNIIIQGCTYHHRFSAARFGASSANVSGSAVLAQRWARPSRCAGDTLRRKAVVLVQPILPD